MADSQSTVAYREVPDFPGYRIGTDGSVWTRRQIRGGFASGREWKRLKEKKHNSHCGYLCVGIRRDGKAYLKLIHRLVLQVFVGPCPEGMQAAHEDGNPKNNNLANLRWKTAKENAADRKRHGTQARGERMGMAVLTDALATEILRRVANGERQRHLAREYGICVQTINNLARGKTFKHIGRPGNE